MLSPVPSSDSKQPLVKQPAFRLALTYAIVAALWIVFSDTVAEAIAPSRGAIEIIEAVKGWVFVAITATGLYYMVRHLLRTVQERERAIVRQKQEYQAEMEQYRLLLEAADDFVVLIDLKKRYLAVPDRVAGMIGLTAQQMIGKTPHEVFDPEAAQSIEQAIDQVMQTRQPYRIHRHIPDHPKLTWMDSVYSPVFAEDGSVKAILSIGRDVTEPVIAAEKLQRRTEQYRSLLDTISLIGQTLRRDEVLQGVLDRMQAIASDQIEIYLEEENALRCAASNRKEGPMRVGTALEQTERQAIRQLIQAREVVAGCLENGDLCPWQSPDGQRPACWLVVPLMVRGQTTGYLTLSRESVQGFKPEEQETAVAFARSAAVAIGNAQLFENLQRSEEEYRQLLNSVDDMIYHNDAFGNQLFINVRGREIEELDEGDTGIGPWLPFIHPEDRETTLKILDDQLATSDIVHLHNRIVGKRGGIIRVSHRIRALRDSNGKVIGTFGIARDVTEIQRTQESLTVRVHQQAVVAALGQRALLSTDLAALMEEVLSTVVRTLSTDYCKVLELMPGGDRLLLRAGVGWKDGLVGHTIIGTELDSMAGYTLMIKEPVIVEDLRTETRFNGPPLLREHDVVSGLSVIIAGYWGPYGVLGTHSRRPLKFNTDDAYFLQSVANVLAAAIERSRAERALRESEERNRTIVRMAADGIITMDEQGVVDSFNASAERLFGYPAGEVIGQNIRMLVGLPIQEGQEEVVGQRKDGSSFLVDMTTSAIQLGDRLMLISIVRDVTEQVQSAKAVVRHIRQLSIVNRVLQVASAPLGFEQVLDALLTEICEVFNADAADIHLMDAHVGLLYLLAHKGYDIGPDEKYQHQRIDQSLRGSAAREGHVVTFKAPLEADASSPRELAERLKSVAVTPIWARGSISGTLTVMLWAEREFTEDEQALLEALGRGVGITIENARLYAEAQSYAETLKIKIDERTEELQKALVHAQGADRAKSALLSTVSHEMRTPLSSIIGFSNLILSRKPEITKTLEFATAINSEARRLAELINDFLDLQRIESGREVFHYAEVDLADLLQDVIRKQQLEDDVLHTISLDIKPVSWVFADGNRVRQVMLNLLNNALKYSPNGGEIKLSLRQEGDNVIFAIRDQGLGIPPDELDRLFDHFYRGEAAERHRIRGTGLGLGLCREIINVHNGRIWCESPGPNQGSTFSFALPAMQTAKSDQSPENGTEAGPNKLIAIVEDDANFSAYLAERLDVEGYQTHILGFPAATPDYITRLAPSLIILDILQADERIGWRILRELKAYRSTATIPVLVCSSLSATTKARQEGAEGYIAKPVDEAFLIEEVTRVFDKLNAAQEKSEPKPDEPRSEIPS